MLTSFISNKIKENFKHIPTPSQEILIEKISEFVFNEADTSIFLLKGFAGTGKTSIIAALVKTLEELERKSVLLAPTGRAAKVLSSYAGKQAYTIHKKIYRQRTSYDAAGQFALDKNLHKNTIFIVDEASMIANSGNDISIFGSGRLLDDLVGYVYTGKSCKLILLGDTAQLPPVNLEISPALDKNYLRSSYYQNITEVVLTDIVRQSLDSGILFNATTVRQQLSDVIDTSSKLPLPQFTTKKFQDIKSINGQELIEEVTNAYYKHGVDQSIVVCRSNKRANKYNQGIRNSILFLETEISVGDLLMVVKNNYFWMKASEQMDFIANGDIVEVVKIYRYETRYDYRFADVRIRFNDYQDTEVDAKIFLDTLNIETASLSNDDMQKFFFKIAEDYTEVTTKKAKYQKIREDAFFNALQVKFAYAVTCHKAQGGQWEAVFVDQSYMPEDTVDVEYLRWLYTALTRSSKKLFLVNFKKEFFADEN